MIWINILFRFSNMVHVFDGNIIFEWEMYCTDARTENIMSLDLLMSRKDRRNQEKLTVKYIPFSAIFDNLLKPTKFANSSLD